MRFLSWIILFGSSLLPLSGCNSFGQGAPVSCAADSDCPYQWQQCDDQLKVCIRQPQLSACGPLGANKTHDVCHIGQTCKQNVCTPQNIKIGFLVPKLKVDKGDQIPPTSELISQYVIDEVLNPLLKEYNEQAELIVLRDDGDPLKIESNAKSLLSQDVDVVLTYNSTQHLIVKQVFENTNVLIFSRFNRRTDVILKEFSEGIPRPEGRTDFSIAPLIYNDVATLVKHAKEELGCTAIATLLSGEEDDRRFYTILSREEASKYGLCYRGELDLPQDPLQSYDIYVDQLVSLESSNLCFIAAFLQEDVFRPLLQAYQQRLRNEQRQTTLQFIANARILRSSNESSRLLQQLILEDFKDNFTFYRYDIDDARVVSFVDRYITQSYEDKYESYCKDDPTGCGLPTPSGLKGNPFEITLVTDLTTLGVLSVFHAKQNHPSPTHLQHRDSFLDLLKEDSQYLVCQYPKIFECFTRISTNKPTHYTGLSSPMILGNDSRMKSLFETMEFQTLPPEWESIEDPLNITARYDTTAMLAAYEATPLGTPDSCKLPE